MDPNFSLPLSEYKRIVNARNLEALTTGNEMLDAILGPSGLRANQTTINALKNRITSSTRNNGFGMTDEDIKGAILTFKDKLETRHSDRNPMSFLKIFTAYRRTKKNPTPTAGRNTEFVKRDPWFILDTSTFTLVQVIMPGLSSTGWVIDWINQINAFPTAKVERNNLASIIPAGRFKSQTVGNVCKLTNLQGRPECNNTSGILKSRGQHESKYIKIATPNGGFEIYKVGSAGMGVSRLSALIRGARNNTAQQADLFEIKRNGDYGEVFTVYRLNKEPPYVLLKPGDEQIAEQIAGFGRSATLNAALTNNSFFYEKACFWSTDRPALFLCLLLEQPYVRVVNRNLYANLTGVTNAQLLAYVTGLASTTANLIIQEIVNDKMAGNEAWFKKMCIIDTAHDFGGVRAGEPRTQEKHKESLKAYLYNTGQTYLNSTNGRTRYPLSSFVDRVWPSENIEIAFRNILDHFADPARRVMGMDATIGQTNNQDTIRYIEPILQSKNMCIVWDSGSVPKGGLKNYIALAAAKYLDPAA